MTYHLNFPALWPYMPMLMQGLWVTIAISAISTVLGVGLGILGAAIRTSKNMPLLKQIWGIYVELIRNTPFVIQLFFIVFGLPSIGMKLTAGEAAVLAMVINLGAYSTEIIRAGIQATPKGQWEAGRVLGLSRSQIFLKVVLPPSMQRIFPALVSQCIIVMLGSSVVSQVAFEELSFQANLIQARSFLSFEVYLVTTLIYLLLSIAMRQILLLAGRRFFGRAPT